MIGEIANSTVGSKKRGTILIITSLLERNVIKKNIKIVCLSGTKLSIFLLDWYVDKDFVPRYSKINKKDKYIACYLQ